MELNEEEKRQLFQVDGDCQAKVLDELYMTARFTRNPEQRDMVRGLMAKLRIMSDEQCMDLVKDIQKNYHLPYRDFRDCLRQNDRNLFDREHCADSFFHTCQPRMGSDGDQLPTLPVRPWLPGIPNFNLRCNLCGTGTIHPIFQQRACRNLGYSRLYGAAGLCPV